jgi:hypothetical protein
MTKQIEVWVKVDQDGDYEVGTGSEDAAARFTENIGDDLERGTRMVKLAITVPLPSPIEITAEVPDAEGEPTVSVG